MNRFLDTPIIFLLNLNKLDIRLQTKKKEQQAELPKLNRLEGQQQDKSPKDGSPTGRQGGEKNTCPFFLTEGGCRRGKDCQWLYEKDDKRRCWTCGGETTCSRPKGKEQTPKEAAKLEGEESPSKKKAPEVLDHNPTAPMKDLLD